MWTPKRLVLLACGFAVFLTVYVVYAYSFLGGIDGLPPLPVAYWPITDPNREPDPVVKRPPSIINQKLRVAFGEDCPS